MRITDQLYIDDVYISERFVRASGPGGQHVNTSSTAVQLRLDVAHCGLPEPVKQRLVRLAGSRMTKAGELIIQADDQRSQAQNREVARERLKDLIVKASRKPKPRKKTRPSLSSIRKQKQAKQENAEKKALRKAPRPE